MIWSDHGLKEFYRGVVPILIRNGPSNAMFFVLREEAQKLPQKVSQLSLIHQLITNMLLCILQEGVVYRNIQQFVSGACIGAFVSSIFYPLNVIKVVIQCKVGGPSENMFVVLKKIYVDRGSSVRNVYKGMTMNCTRAFFSWGIMNAAYENLKNIVY